MMRRIQRSPEDDETEDGVRIRLSLSCGGDDGDDDDDDSSRDDYQMRRMRIDEDTRRRRSTSASADSAIVLARITSGLRFPYPFHQRQRRALARIDSTMALLDAVMRIYPSPFTTTTYHHHLYIPATVDRSRYASGESSMLDLRGPRDSLDLSARLDAEGKATRGFIDVGRVTELAELHGHDTQDLYALLEDAQDSRSRISQRVDMDLQRVNLLIGDRMTLQDTVTHQELQTHRDHVYAHETHLQAHQTQLQLQSTLIQTQHQVHETRFQMQQAELAALRETDHRRQDQMVETLRVIRDMRREMSDMQAE
ncbi:hypothetical protein Tco_1441223, partial [Tanacetum coccineum]